MMHRLFAGLSLPAPLRSACLSAMEDGPSGWAWQDAEQLHLTLRFIGEVERPLAEDIALALGRTVAPAIEIGLAGVGWFDDGPRGPLFARVTPREPLAALHRKIDHALIRLGLEPERRAYLPHVTLARRRSGAAHPGEWLERSAGLAAAPVAGSAMILYESHLSRAGPSYEAVARYALG